MIDERTKNRAHDLVQKAIKKSLVTKYKDFCKTKESDEYAIPKEDVIYYTSRRKGEAK